jgi:hypothetical protein
MQIRTSSQVLATHGLAAKIGCLALAGVFLVIALGLFSAVPIWWLWNAIMPGAFGLPPLTLPQAIGLTVLVKLLIGSQVKLGHDE